MSKCYYLTILPLSFYTEKVMRKLRQVIDEFMILPDKSKLGVVGLLFFVFVFGFFGTVFYWRMKGPRETAPSTQIPFVKEEPKSNLASLSLVPKSQSLKTEDTFLVTINFKTGDNKVDTVDAVLTFDPELLTVEEISEGMFFAEYPIKKIEDGKVMLTGTIGASGKQVGGAKGEGALASVTFKALKAGSANVSFDKASLVASKGKDVLGETKGAVFEIY